MKKILTTTILALVISFIYSQENTDAVFKNLVKEYTLNKDGSIDYREIKEIELHSHYAFHRLYGETFIIYNTDFQDLKINSSYTIMKDGKKIVTPHNAYNEVLPRFCNNAPAYNHIRELVVTHTGLEVGSTINLDYSIHTQKGYYPGLMETELLFNSSPTKSLEIVINIPEDKDLYYSLLNIDREPVVKNKDGVKTYVWKFENLPATSKESFQPKYNTSVPQLQFSTLTLEEAYYTFVNQDAFSLKTSESMDTVVSDVVSKCDDKLKTTLKLQKWVSNNLGNLNIPLKYSGFKVRNTIDTWESNQGTSLEKSLLLESLLDKAGIESEVVVIIPSLYYGNTGNLNLFFNFAVRVKIQKQNDILISSNKVNTQSLSYNLQGMTILPLLNDGKPKSYEPKSFDSEIEIKSEIKHLHGTDPEANMILELENNQNPYFSILFDSSYVKGLVNGTKSITQNEILEIESDETEASLIYTPKIRIEGMYHFLTLPFSPKGISSWRMNQLPLKRTVPLEVPELITEQFEYSITIPGDAYLVTNETMTIIDNEIGSIKIYLYQKDTVINFERSISLKKNVISPVEYPEFKKIMDLWNTSIYKEIVYKRTKK